MGPTGISALSRIYLFSVPKSALGGAAHFLIVNSPEQMTFQDKGRAGKGRAQLRGPRRVQVPGQGLENRKLMWAGVGHGCAGGHGPQTPVGPLGTWGVEKAR